MLILPQLQIFNSILHEFISHYHKILLPAGVFLFLLEVGGYSLPISELLEAHQNFLLEVVSPKCHNFSVLLDLELSLGSLVDYYAFEE